MERKLKVLVRMGRAFVESKSTVVFEVENRRGLRRMTRKTGPRDDSPVPGITIRSVEDSFGLR